MVREVGVDRVVTGHCHGVISKLPPEFITRFVDAAALAPELKTKLRSAVEARARKAKAQSEKQRFSELIAALAK